MKLRGSEQLQINKMGCDFMKIEKINDNQIRCTLDRSDLLSREIKISELAYGTEKAKTLFHDMIEQASHDFGFEAEEAPLMIEAIPVSSECIVLIITKVDDPEELDTRFSKFATAIDDEPDDEEGEDNDFILDEVFSLFDMEPPKSEKVPANPDNFIPMAETVPDITKAKSSDNDAPAVELTRIFSFNSWDLASEAALQIGDNFKGTSVLYKSAKSGVYYLTLHAAPTSDTGFFMACNICSEYGNKENFNSGSLGYLNEHCDLIIAHDAINILCRY